jgi:hypothetical protein
VNAAIGSAADLALSGGPCPAPLQVAIGDVEVPAGGRVVRFAARRRGDDDLLVWTSGAGLWRRAPLPAADALFDLGDPPVGASALVVGEGEAGAEVARKLSERDVAVETAQRLTREALERCGTVLLLDADEPSPVSHVAAAAGRVLVVADVAPLFGLQDGHDCFVSRHPDEAVAVAAAVARHPEAFADVRVLARVSAERQRASRVYAGLAVDLDLGLDGVPRNARSASST